MAIIIAIAGASASGKSHFANHLFEMLSQDKQVTVISEDSYYKPQCHLTIDERAALNFDHPAAIDDELMQEHLAQLKQGEDILKPVYCYHTHTRIDQQPHQSSEVLILEGLHVLSRPNLEHLVDLKIFIDTPMDICLLRRTNRDVQERGRTVESVFEQYLNTVRPMYIEHIEPSKYNAHIVINGEQAIDNMWLELDSHHLFKSLTQG